MDENCTIICNQDSGCKYSTFFVYNNSINIVCSGYQSCYGTKIISKNVKLLNITFSGYQSFWGTVGSSYISIDNPDGDVFIECSGSNSLYIYICYYFFFDFQYVFVNIYCRLC